MFRDRRKISMNEVMIFSNKEFGNVRTVIIDGEPWFLEMMSQRLLVIQKPTKR